MTHPAGPAATPFSPLGFWAPDGSTLSHEPAAFGAAVGDLRAPVVVVRTDRPYTEPLLRFFRMRERRQ